MQCLVRRAASLARPVASTSAAIRTLATHATLPTPPTTATPAPARAKYLVLAKPDRPKQARLSPKSSRLAGRTPAKPRKALSPLAAGATQATAGSVQIFLPSVFVRLVRNTGAHADDPYTATFRTDLRLTKPDITNYLQNIYGLAVTSIRTINYSSPLSRNPIGGGYSRGGGTKSYKKVLVTLEEPFWYPEERSREWCIEHFQREAMEDMRDRKMLKIGDGQKYGVNSERYRGAGKLRAEVDRLKAIATAGGAEVDMPGDGKSSQRRPSGRKMRKNVVRSRAERIDEKKSTVEREMDRLREAGWVRHPLSVANGPRDHQCLLASETNPLSCSCLSDDRRCEVGAKSGARGDGLPQVRLDVLPAPLHFFDTVRIGTRECVVSEVGARL